MSALVVKDDVLVRQTVCDFPIADFIAEAAGHEAMRIERERAAGHAWRHGQQQQSVQFRVR